MKKDNWTKENYEYLEQNLSKMTCKEISQNINKSIDEVKRRANKIFSSWESSILDGFVVLEDFPNYSINSNGVVIRNRTRRIIVPHPDGKDYLVVCLTNKSTQKIHRLVAKTFIPNYDETKNTVNHKDGNKLNNSISNLEWMSNLENMRHSYETGLRINAPELMSKAAMGENNSSAKLSEKDVLNIYSLVNSGLSDIEIATKYNVTRTNIIAIRTGRSWKHLYSLFECSTTREKSRTLQANGSGNGGHPLIEDEDIVCSY